MLVGSIAGPRVAQAQESGVDPDVGRPGTTFDFFADGFDENDRVSYWVNMPNGEIDSDDALYNTSANSDGRADWSWTAPDDAMLGQYLMVAEGSEGVQQAIPFEVAPTEAGAPAPPDATRGVDPDVGRPGTTFDFFADGFAGDLRVSYWVNMPNGEIDSDDALYNTSANRDGRADWSWTAPGDAMLGQYTMVAEGSEGVQQVIPFEVAPTEAGAPAPPDAEKGVDPDVGSPGTTFDFFADGFAGDLRVSYWVNMPNGEIDSDDALYNTSANRDGRADWSWTAPDDAMPGQYTMVAEGSEGVQQVIPFEVR
jgi:5-hydroxyisourate hydrolase-like protein (transthyretin family)